mgnify:CR=1 FL=1
MLSIVDGNQVPVIALGEVVANVGTGVAPEQIGGIAAKLGATVVEHLEKQVTVSAGAQGRPSTDDMVKVTDVAGVETGTSKCDGEIWVPVTKGPPAMEYE